MNYSTSIKPISYLKAHASEIINTITETQSPMIITQNGVATAVVQDVKSYEQTQESLALLKMIAQGEEDIAAGRTRPAREVFAEMRVKLQEMR